MPQPVPPRRPRSSAKRDAAPRRRWGALHWLGAAALIFVLGAGLGLSAGWLSSERQRSEEVRQAERAAAGASLLASAEQTLALLDEIQRTPPARFGTEDDEGHPAREVAGLFPEGGLGGEGLEVEPSDPGAGPATENLPPLIAPRVAPGEEARIAIVIDDLGLNRPNAERTVALPGPLTLAFMTYAENVQGLIDHARSLGHEIIVHVPMQPMSDSVDPGPQVLRVDLSEEELAERLDWGLERFEGYVGINNHMGSRFTSDAQGMDRLMAVLKERGLWFLDSLTSAESKAGEAARRHGVPLAVRDVFLDNDRHAEMVRQQLLVTEKRALERGYAIAIGHPHSETIEALAAWLPTLEERGFELVPVSALLRRPAATAERVPPSAIEHQPTPEPRRGTGAEILQPTPLRGPS